MAWSHVLQSCKYIMVVFALLGLQLCDSLKLQHPERGGVSGGASFGLAPRGGEKADVVAHSNEPVVGWMYGHPIAEFHKEQRRVAAARLLVARTDKIQGGSLLQVDERQNVRWGKKKKKEKGSYSLDLCLYKCNNRGACIQDLLDPGAGTTSLPEKAFKCKCERSWTGSYCEKRVDVLLQWLMTRGRSDRPPCCNVCTKQVLVD